MLIENAVGDSLVTKMNLVEDGITSDSPYPGFSETDLNLEDKFKIELHGIYSDHYSVKHSASYQVIVVYQKAFHNLPTLCCRG